MSGRSLTAAERETVVLMSDEDDTATITTSQRRILGKLRRNAQAEEVSAEMTGTSETATFRLPAALVSFRTQRRTMPPERAAHLQRRPHDAVAPTEVA